MYNENRKKSIQKYLANQKQIRFWVKPEEYDLMQKVAKEQGFDSMRKFFLTAIYEKMGKDRMEFFE